MTAVESWIYKKVKFERSKAELHHCKNYEHPILWKCFNQIFAKSTKNDFAAIDNKKLRNLRNLSLDQGVCVAKIRKVYIA